MEIRYERTYRDWQEGYRVGLSHLTLLYRLVWCCVTLFILVGLALTVIGRGYPATWPPKGLPPKAIVQHTSLFVLVLLVCYLSATLIFGYFTRVRTVQLLPVHLAWKSNWSSNLIRWKDITDIVQTSEYVFFCQNTPSAIVVPKSAFRSQAQVTAFVEEAERYWRSETGRNDIPPTENTGIWPPAPRVDDSPKSA